MQPPSRRKFLKHAATSFVAAPFILKSVRADEITRVGRPRLGSAIRAALEDAPIGSSHEHTLPEARRLDQKLDIFTIIAGGYGTRDLSAPVYGQRPPGWGNTQQSIKERWRIFEPQWRRARNTTFVVCNEIALRDLYGAEDLNEDTVEEISARVTAANTPGVTMRYFNRSRHKFVVLDDKLPEPNKPELDIYHIARRFDRFVVAGTRFELDEISKSTGVSIQTLDDMEKALEKDFEKALRNTRLACVKSTLAYQRALDFGKPSRADAERDFEKVASNQAQPKPLNDPATDRYEASTNIPTRNLQDYIFRRILGLVNEHKLPMQIHTGYQISNNVVQNSNPLHLTRTFLDFPNVQFDLFHAGWPFLRETIAQAKLFANVHIDLCWAQTISGSAMRSALREYIDTLPSTRVIGFGGDCQYTEHSYAYAVMARDNVIRVLEDMVADGDLQEKQAIEIGHRILLKNPEELFISRRTA